MNFEKLEENILIYCITASLVLASLIYSGFVLTFLWGFTMVPIFHLPLITVAQGISLMLLFTFTRKALFCKLTFEPLTTDPLEIFMNYFSRTTEYLVFGFLISLFIL